MQGEKVWTWLLIPVTWWARPHDVAPLEQTAWQRGKASVAANARTHPFQFLLSVVPGGLTAVAASNLVLGFVVAAAGYCFVPLLWALAVAVHAPIAQREEAREMVKAEREQTREAQRQARTQELQAKLVASKLRAVQEIPPFIEQVPDPLEGYSGARNQILWRLQAWIEEAAPALREGGFPELAAEFESDDKEAGSSRGSLQAAYEKRLRLLTAVPDLKLVE